MKHTRFLLALGVAALRLTAQTATHPTFAKDVAPILQQNCQSCHRPGEAAPFSLLTYEQARPWAKAIKAAVLQKKMPPWFADPQFGKFANRRLAVPEATSTRWWPGWMPALPWATRKDMPPPRQFVEGWTIPKPDIVFQLPKPFPVPATGVLEYQYVIIPTGFTQDTWVRARAGRADQLSRRSTTSSRTCASRAPTTSRTCRRTSSSRRPRPRTDAAKAPKDDVPNDWLTGYAPGQPPDMFKPGQAKLIPAGSDIVLEIHYMPRARRRRTSRAWAWCSPSSRPPSAP